MVMQECEGGTEKRMFGSSGFIKPINKLVEA